MLESFSKEKIIKLCSDNYLSQSCKRWRFWVSEVYGLGRAFREYAYFYPKKLPLYIYSNHGPYFSGEIPKHELESEAPVQFYNWSKSVKEFKQKSKKPCFQIEWPYIFYKKKYGIERVAQPNGTVVFPFHSTPLDKEVFNIQAYMSHLKKLPDKFKPLYICLHKHDIDKGIHNIYSDAGFNVCTAGHYSDDNFIDRFYDILKQFKYSTSNEVSSYAFYSIEMGIPFFVYGENSKIINFADSNYEIGEIKFEEIDGYTQAYNLFKVNPFEDEINISSTQIDYVNDKLGVDSNMSRLKFTIILWCSFCLFKLNPNRIIKKIVKKIRKYLNN